ncbi:hypothetical protein WEI85_00510 [Actinomycetes bacterium KLBMP 9797]
MNAHTVNRPATEARLRRPNPGRQAAIRAGFPPSAAGEVSNR